MSKMFKTLFAGTLAIGLIGGAFATGTLAVVLLPSEPAIPQNTAMVRNVSVLAKTAILYDVNSGTVLYQKNANREMPLASLTKLMGAYSVLASRDGSTVVEITPDTIATEGDTGLRAGEAYELTDLVRLALVASSNDAAAAVATSLGEDYLLAMNSAAQHLGLTKTRFLNPTGLDLGPETAGGYGSAYDVARLAAAFFKAHPALFEETVHADVSVSKAGGELVAAATAAPLRDIPGLIGGKTGFTDLAGGNLVVAFDLEVGRPVIAVVLGSTREGRFSDIRTLISAARAQL